MSGAYSRLERETLPAARVCGVFQRCMDCTGNLRLKEREREGGREGGRERQRDRERKTEREVDWAVKREMDGLCMKGGREGGRDRQRGGLGGKERNGWTVHEQCLNRHVFFRYICMSKCMRDDRFT